MPALGSLSLFVFHSYSPFGQPENDDENLDFDAYWYMGSTQKFRANIAFSLYGKLKGSNKKGCSCDTFINSFFTTWGVQSFVQAMQLQGYLQNQDAFYAGGNGVGGFSSVCTRNINDDGYSADAYAYGNGYDISDYVEAGSQRFPNAVSYTLGCYNGAFRMEEYSGAACAKPYFTQAIETMDSANSALHSMGCAEIYDSSTYSSYENYMTYWNNQYDGGEGGDYFEEDEADSLPEITYPLDLLKYSQSCSLRLYGAECPDPCNKVKQYLDKLNRGTRLVVTYDSAGSWMRRHLPAYLLTLGGLVLFGLAYHLHVKGKGVGGAPSIKIKNIFKKNAFAPEQGADGVVRDGDANGEQSVDMKEKLKIFAENLGILGMAVVGGVMAAFTRTKEVTYVTYIETMKSFEPADTIEGENFRVGDHVVLQNIKSDRRLNGKEGTIKEVTTGASREKRYVIELDFPPNPMHSEFSLKATHFVLKDEKEAENSGNTSEGGNQQGTYESPQKASGEFKATSSPQEKEVPSPTPKKVEAMMIAPPAMAGKASAPSTPDGQSSLPEVKSATSKDTNNTGSSKRSFGFFNRKKAQD